MKMANACRFTAALAVLLAFAGCDLSVDGDSDSQTRVNGSVHVAAGKPAGEARTVNGSIHVDDDAAVTSVGTVNGSIRLGAHASASTAKTVNGAITLGAGARIAEGAGTVNGDLTLVDGSEVKGRLVNVNGKINLTGAHVGEGIKTVNGSISILGASRVEGGIVVDKPGSFNFNNDDPVIVIGPGAVVQGDLRFERKVKLYVSDKATVGTITGATAVPFSGDTPPTN